MSLSNIDKKHLEELCLSLNTSSTTSHNQLEVIKSNHVQYARLKQIAKDMERLRAEALQVIDEASFQSELHGLKHTFRLTSGNTYYVYEKNNLNSNQSDTQRYLSLISPEEWNNKDHFVGKYFYDYDKQFIKV